MALFSFNTSYKSIKDNHAMLKRSKRGAFYVHKMNGFIQTESPKPNSETLSLEQQQLFRKKTEEYTKLEYQSIFRTAVVTLVITVGIFLLLGELWQWIS